MTTRFMYTTDQHRLKTVMLRIASLERDKVGRWQEEASRLTAAKEDIIGRMSETDYNALTKNEARKRSVAELAAEGREIAYEALDLKMAARAGLKRN